MFNGRINYAQSIPALLWSAAGLTIVLASAGGTWAVLDTVGDASGASAAKAAVLVILICWMLNAAGLLVLTAMGVAELDSRQTPHTNSRNNAWVGSPHEQEDLRTQIMRERADNLNSQSDRSSESNAAADATSRIERPVE